MGFDLDLDYIRPYIHQDGIRVNTGIKYNRVTGPTERKEPYARKLALAQGGRPRRQLHVQPAASGGGVARLDGP